jgi:hypothetical protein
MDGHKFESLEVIVDNDQGLIVERTIALRPYPALKLFRDGNANWSALTGYNSVLVGVSAT